MKLFQRFILLVSAAAPLVIATGCGPNVGSPSGTAVLMGTLDEPKAAPAADACTDVFQVLGRQPMHTPGRFATLLNSIYEARKARGWGYEHDEMVELTKAAIYTNARPADVAALYDAIYYARKKFGWSYEYEELTEVTKAALVTGTGADQAAQLYDAIYKELKALGWSYTMPALAELTKAALYTGATAKTTATMFNNIYFERKKLGWRKYEFAELAELTKGALLGGATALHAAQTFNDIYVLRRNEGWKSYGLGELSELAKGALVAGVSANQTVTRFVETAQALSVSPTHELNTMWYVGKMTQTSLLLGTSAQAVATASNDLAKAIGGENLGDAPFETRAELAKIRLARAPRSLGTASLGYLFAESKRQLDELSWDQRNLSFTTEVVKAEALGLSGIGPIAPARLNQCRALKAVLLLDEPNIGGIKAAKAKKASDSFNDGGASMIPIISSGFTSGS